MTAFDSSHRIDLLPCWNLTLAPAAQAYIDTLDPNFDDRTVDDYLMFIKCFGTHIWKNARVSLRKSVLLGSWTGNHQGSVIFG